MTDPLLLAHTVRPFHFDIGGKISPSSIRDQMFRGRVLVDRAYEQGLINSNRPLLVIGAGAAGVTAAIRAAQLDMPTVLIERNSSAFDRQAVCTTRWVCPTQYDWPLEHWQQGHYPWLGPSMPLPWGASYANMLAVVWSHELSQAQARYRNLTFLPNTVIDRSKCQADGSFATNGYQLEVYLTPHGGPHYFGMALSSMGPGTETTVVGDYKGFSFWDTDPFEEDYFGLNQDANPYAIISGGGDGALQDFLRVITKKKSANDIYQSLSPFLKEEIENRIQTADDQAQRAHVWGSTWQHDCQVFSTLHDAYQDAIDELATSGIWRRVGYELGDLIFASAHSLQVKLVHPCEHFTKCYALNRFLVLLIDKFIKQEVGRSLIEANTAIIGVKGVRHTCQLDPIDCHGEDHEVRLGSADCEVLAEYLSGRGAIPSKSVEPYQVVIIRHGVKAQSFIVGGHAGTNSRHLLPYYVAW
jgi:hypothetical protein